MELIAEIFKALSDNNRLKVVIALTKKEELCACDIINIMDVTGATVSRHMSILLHSSIVKSRKEGRWVYYTLNRNDDFINAIILNIEKIATGQNLYDAIGITITESTSCSR